MEWHRSGGHPSASMTSTSHFTSLLSFFPSFFFLLSSFFLLLSSFFFLLSSLSLFLFILIHFLILPFFSFSFISLSPADWFLRFRVADFRVDFPVAHHLYYYYCYYYFCYWDFVKEREGASSGRPWRFFRDSQFLVHVPPLAVLLSALDDSPRDSLALSGIGRTAPICFRLRQGLSSLLMDSVGSGWLFGVHLWRLNQFLEIGLRRQVQVYPQVMSWLIPKLTTKLSTFIFTVLLSW